MMALSDYYKNVWLWWGWKADSVARHSCMAAISGSYENVWL